MNKKPLKILFVSSEVAPYSKTGGLADISAALPQALVDLGADVRVLTPRYGFVDVRRFGFVPEHETVSGTMDIRGRPLRFSFWRSSATTSSPMILLLECPPLYDRPGIYVDPFTNRDYIDNDYRFILLSRAALVYSRVSEWVPDILHAQDWQTALVPFYLNRARARGELTQSRSLLTIHNIAYQGLFGPETAARIGDADGFFYPGGPLEFYGHVAFLKAGIEFADLLTTVSPTYAREIQSSYEFGFGLDAVLRAREDRLVGILNGLDTRLWDPATDPHLAANYDAESLEKKEVNKRALCARCGLTYEPARPVFGMVSRLVAQKGLEILLPVLSDILHLPSCVVVLGSGDPYFEHVLREYARIYPDRFAVFTGYDEALAHAIEAGADIFLMPSKYEPCGLNQLMSMRYGTPPLVRATGGLADTVTDADQDPEHGTGFSFTEFRPEALLHAVRRALLAFTDRTRWRAIQRRAMNQDFSWQRSAQRYYELYEQCLRQPPRAVRFAAH